MLHRLDRRGLGILAVPQLLTEAEDHQQRVVDRHAKADQRDEELHDQRHVRHVREPPDQRERVEDRCDRDCDRHQDRGQRPEHEQEDHERAAAADQGFRDHARPRAAGRVVERVPSGEMDAGDAGGAAQIPLHEVADVAGVRLGVEALLAGGIDVGERGVAVLRYVGEAAGVEVRAHARAGVHGGRRGDPLLEPGHLRDIAGRTEDRHRRVDLAGVVALEGDEGGGACGLEFPAESEGVALGRSPVERVGGEVGQPGAAGRVAGAPEAGHQRCGHRRQPV